MKIRHLEITNFRGIKALRWNIRSDFIALVGPGDSTKTTILDALGFALSSRYNLTFTDADFYACDTTSPIVIEVAIVDLPTTLIEERTHGKNRSGIRDDGTYVHDPVEEDGVEECLIIRLTVDESLEPVWEVVRPGEPEGDRITASERSQLGFFRIGDQSDFHLRWARGSALSALTASRTHATSAVVEAQRRAREAVSDLTDTPLHEAAKIAQESVKELGSGPFSELQPGLDPHLMSGTSAIVLHDEGVPLTQHGLGSRRLLSLAIQEQALAGKSMVAIDELETGLDPHRLSHLVRYLRDKVRAGDLQVFLTTHSALVVEALSVSELGVVRSTAGTSTVTGVPKVLEAPKVDVLQGVMRERPSALLARRIVVGEGATEVGFLREVLHRLDEKRPSVTDLTSVTAGATVSNGSGSTQAPPRSTALAELGYPTALVIDGDVQENAAAIADSRAAGVTVVQWPEGDALEDVVVRELDLEALQRLVDFAVDERSDESVRTTVQTHLGGPRLMETVVTDWIATFGEDRVRKAIAAAAKGAKADGSKQESKAWFKREDRGEQLGALVMDGLEGFQEDGALRAGIGVIETFVYKNPAQPHSRESSHDPA